MLTHVIIPAIVLLAAAAAAAYYYARRSPGMQRKVRALEQIAQFTPGTAGFRRLTPCFRGVLDGLQFSVELPRTSSASGIGLEISVFTVPLFQLEMHRGIDTTGAEGERGQMDYDIGDDPYSKAPQYLDDAQRKQYIWNFLSTGFTSFCVEKDRVRILMPNCDLDEDLKPSAVYIQLLALVQLAKSAAH